MRPPSRQSSGSPIQRLFLIIVYLIYILSPVDLIPDVAPVVGWLDDAVAAIMLVNELTGRKQKDNSENQQDSTES